MYSLCDIQTCRCRVRTRKSSYAVVEADSRSWDWNSNIGPHCRDMRPVARVLCRLSGEGQQVSRRTAREMQSRDIPSYQYAVYASSPSREVEVLTAERESLVSCELMTDDAKAFIIISRTSMKAYYAE